MNLFIGLFKYHYFIYIKTKHFFMEIIIYTFKQSVAKIILFSIKHLLTGLFKHMFIGLFIDIFCRFIQTYVYWLIYTSLLVYFISLFKHVYWFIYTCLFVYLYNAPSVYRQPRLSPKFSSVPISPIKNTPLYCQTQLPPSTTGFQTQKS